MNIEEQLKEFDYIFSLNANIIPLKPIGEEILHSAQQGLCGEYYFMGGFNGGCTAVVLHTYHDMLNNIQKDLEKGIIIVWYGESHLNSYVLDKNPLILLPEHGYPEGWVPQTYFY